MSDVKRLIVCVLSLALALTVVSPAAVNAISEEQRRVFDSGVYYFNVDKDSGLGCGRSGNLRFPDTMDPGQLGRVIEDYIRNTRPDSPLIGFANDFVRLGKQYNVNPAIVVALAQYENSFATVGNALPPQYNVFNVRNGPGSSFGSYPGYLAAIEANNVLLSGPLYLGPPASITTIEQLVHIYAPSSDGNDERAYVQKIEDVMAKILGGQQGGGPGSTTSGFGCVVSGGVVNTDGYAWPVAPQKQSQNGTLPYLSQVPCPQASCHADGTAAFDLSRQPGGDAGAGTPLFAISDGVIDSLHLYNDIPDCYSLQLRSTKDNNWYWYGHIQNPVVRNDQPVKAGQQIAEIGVSKCTGNGSTPHLHIDRGCTIDGVPQKGGRQACRDPGFTDFMNKLFATLPP